MENQGQVQSEVRETARLEAFSDGVFAIAITLLVLEIRLPEVEAGGLLAALGALWPTYLAYFASFITIGITWANHDTLFKMVRRVDRNMLLINALLLMVLTFLNFPTVVLAEYLQTEDAGIAMIFYSGTLLAAALLYNAVWHYAAYGRRLLYPHVSNEMFHDMNRRYIFGILSYGVAFLLAFISAPLSLAVCIGLAIFFALPQRTR